MRDANTWTNTYSGAQFWPTDPRIEDIRIHDIARGLSHQPRFSGQTRFHYSVAQHSVLVCRLAPPAHKLKALLHDAEEAYFVDMPGPLKHAPEMVTYRTLSEGCRNVVFARFDLEPGVPTALKEIENRLLITEALALVPDKRRHPEWFLNWPYEPYTNGEVEIERWSHARARREFLDLFDQLYSEPRSERHGSRRGRRDPATLPAVAPVPV